MAPPRTFHDRHSKTIIESLLTVASTVIVNYEIEGVVQHTDAMAELKVELGPRTPQQRAQQGLLGRIDAKHCLIENYRNTPGLHEMRACISRQHNFYLSLVRKARSGTGKDKGPGPGKDQGVEGSRAPSFPALWINSSGRPKTIIRDYHFEQIPDWPRGCLCSVPGLNTYLIDISALDETEETLGLRLLGRDRVAHRALNQLFELPADSELRQRLLPTVLDFKLNPASDLLTKQLDEEAMSYLNEIYSRYNAWETSTLARGHEAGRKEGLEEGGKKGQRRTLLELLRLKFKQEVDQAVVDRINAASRAELDRWTQQFLTAEKLDDLFAAD